MNAPQTHLEHSPATQQACDGCGSPFTPKRRWQRFCKTTCRATYHLNLSPEALRREVDELKRQGATLRTELDTEKARVTDLERRVTTLDDPTRR